MQHSQWQIPIPMHAVCALKPYVGYLEIILLKLKSEKKIYIYILTFFAVILIEPASKLEVCQQISHLKLNVPPHVSAPL